MGGRIFRSPGYSPLKRFAYKRFMRQLFAEHPEYKIVEAHNDGVGAFTLEAAKKAGVPIVNYGIAIAQMHSILRRSLEPFPEILKILDK